MPNTNFQTIHQMGQAINNVVRQATGRDAVQNIDMNHVTVAQNHYYEEVTLSAGRVSFTDRVGNTPLEKCVVQIEPVQDLHGYDRPWLGGGGKNKLNIASMNLGGTEPRTVRVEIDAIPAGTYTFTATNTGTETTSGKYGMQFFSVSGGQNIGEARNDTTFTLTEEAKYIYFYMSSDSYSDGKTVILSNMMIRLASVTDDTYEPYSNICPITGWTDADIHVSPTTDAQDGMTYSITFPSEAGTVYGGTLDVTTGTLLITDGYIASYNGEALPGRWISDRDAYAVGTSPSTGAEVVYELANPITYQTTPQEIRTLIGQNYIWADTGDIEVKCKVLKELY